MCISKIIDQDQNNALFPDSMTNLQAGPWAATTTTTLAAPEVATTTSKTVPTVRYLYIVENAARGGTFKVERGEGECDVVVVWRSDVVNTAQTVVVVSWEVRGLYDTTL